MERNLIFKFLIKKDFYVQDITTILPQKNENCNNRMPLISIENNKESTAKNKNIRKRKRDSLQNNEHNHDKEDNEIILIQQNNPSKKRRKLSFKQYIGAENDHLDDGEISDNNSNNHGGMWFVCTLDFRTNI